MKDARSSDSAIRLMLFAARDEPERWCEALAIRTRVFIEEQGVSQQDELDDHDTLDPSCLHALLQVGGVPAATGRIYEPKPGEGKIGRMAVLPPYRGRGTGMALLDVLIKEGRRRHLGSLVLDAQTHALGFYAKRGFVAEGRAFLDCGIPHQAMRLRLASP